MPGSVLVLILNWRRPDDTVACLRSLFALGRSDLYPIVIDNGSGDGSEAIIRAAFPAVPLIQTGSNLGYAGGNNVGLRLALQSRARYVMLLNNDTLLRQDLFRPLLDVAAAANDQVVLGPKTLALDEGEAVQFSGMVWLRDELRFRATRDDESEMAYGHRLYRTAYIQGAALLIPLSVLKEVGLFDERFFLLYEETDWCFRAKKKGNDCWVVPESCVWHGTSPSFGGRRSPMYEYFMTRNQLLWYEKQVGRWTALSRFGKPLYWELRCRFRRLRMSNVKLKQALNDPVNCAFLRAHWDYLLRRFGDCPSWMRRPQGEV